MPSLRDMMRNMRRPTAETALDQHLATLGRSVQGLKKSDPRVYNAVVRCHAEARRIRDENADIAALRDFPGWQRLEKMLRARMMNFVRAEHALALRDPVQCRMNAVAIEEDAFILNLFDTAVDQYDRSAEIVNMKASQLLRRVQPTENEE